MKFTGERYVPTEQGEIHVEHYHRYVLAQRLAKDKIVLDMASGEGYGSALLGQVATQVVGVDISAEVVAHARESYSHLKNLRFECCNAIRTGLPDTFFDVVVSFETVEHLAEQEQMLAEIRRVLKPTGVLIISSPNRPVYSDGRDYHNEFHVRELDFNELDTLLRPHFGQIAYYGQRLAMGTVIQPIEGHAAGYRAYSDDGQHIEERTSALQAPMYFIAVCGSADVLLPSLDASIFMPDALDLVEHYVGFARWAKNQERELELRDNNVRHYKNEAAQFEARSRQFHEEIVLQTEELKKLERQQALLRVEIVRAEAQLELLKDIWLGDDSESI